MLPPPALHCRPSGMTSRRPGVWASGSSKLGSSSQRWASRLREWMPSPDSNGSSFKRISKEARAEATRLATLRPAAAAQHESRNSRSIRSAPSGPGGECAGFLLTLLDLERAVARCHHASTSNLLVFPDLQHFCSVRVLFLSTCIAGHFLPHQFDRAGDVCLNLLLASAAFADVGFFTFCLSH